ncbi:hypothetical protein [Nocardioides sp. NPDC127503]|uniref:hypothetical protein n=1 Tax=Nocardioides sp. NPDC127503 TaxID=3154516 RepID=UPI00332CEA28
MTQFEDQVRHAIDRDIAAEQPAQQMLAKVRRGAQRRRVRRTAGVISAAAVLVAGVAVGGSLLSTRDDSAPEPAPPAPSPTESSSATGDPVRPTHALTIEAALDRVFVTSNEEDCGCSVLWRYDGETWERLHDFTEEYVERLAMAPDGRSGWAAAPGGRIWTTDDGGGTWEQAVMRSEDPGDHSYLLAATGDPVWPVWAVDATTGTMWRFDGDRFESVSYDEIGAAQDLIQVGDALVVTPKAEDEGNVTSVPRVTHDGGRTWSELPFPCSGETRLIPARTAIFSLCQAGEAATTVYRSTDLITWQEFGGSQGHLNDRVALTDDAILLRGERETLLTETGAQQIETGLSKDATVWDAARVGDTLYLAPGGDVLASTDGGRTWEPSVQQ